MNMKIVKTNFFIGYNKIITLILAIIGFATACKQIADEYGGPPVEYGTPHAKFIVKGTILSEDSSKAISNIKVVMGHDSSLSDSQGKYLVSTDAFPISSSFLMKLRDIDKQTNREFQSLDTTIEFKDPEFTNGDGHWYNGETTKDLNIKMKPKN